jgi:hypothetical protein
VVTSRLWKPVFFEAISLSNFDSFLTLFKRYFSTPTFQCSLLTLALQLIDEVDQALKFSIQVEAKANLEDVVNYDEVSCV